MIMTDTGVLDLDRPDDLKLMEVIAAYLFDNDQGMHAVRQRAEKLALVKKSRGRGSYSTRISSRPIL